MSSAVNEIRLEMDHLQQLLSYLEDRETLGAKEYLFCQARLHETVKRLKKVEHILVSQKSN